MKTFAFIICLLGTIFLKFADYSNHYKKLSEKKQVELDSLKLMLRDLERDTIIHKMLTDFAYRTKVNTLVKVVPDGEIVRLINRHAKTKETKARTSSVAKKKNASRNKSQEIVLNK